MGIISYFFGRTPEKEEVGKEIRKAAADFNKALNQAYDLGLAIDIDLHREWRRSQYRYTLKVNYVREYKQESY